MLTPRARMNMALSYQEPDRPPLDLGSTPNTGITKIAYQRLLQYLKLDLDYEPRVINVPFQVVEVDEAVLEILHIDTRPMYANPPERSQAGYLPDGGFRDEWGVVYKPVKSHEEILYYEMVEHPLSQASSIRNIEEHSWPDSEDCGRYYALHEKARTMCEKTDYAIVGHPGFTTSIFQTACALRGYTKFFIDLAKNKDFAHVLLNKIVEIQMQRMNCYLAEVGEYLEVVCVGDDFCSQEGPFISLTCFREMIKPYLQKYYEAIKNRTRAKLHLHSCGAVHYLLDDLLEIGVDIINPVQVTARGMNPEQLKKRFGTRLVFWGGIDTQRILPYGTAEEVRKEVRRMVKILGVNGGHILSAVHNIQPDVPPENVVAMFDEACGAGKRGNVL